MKALCERDLSKECDGKYKDCVDCVLDKIRAEIEEIIWEETVIEPGSENEYIVSKVDPDDVLQIIDKYRK